MDPDKPVMSSAIELESDYRSVPGQNYAVISVIGPDCPQKSDKFGLKISGCFATQDEASSYAKKLHKDNGNFDLYVCNLYKWL
jgi:hypothetical protein